MNSGRIDLLLVNPPTLVLEKPDYLISGTLFQYRVENINPGILSMASYLFEKGIRLKIIDLSIAKGFTELEEYLQVSAPRIIGVSSTCCYDYLESLRCLEMAKRLSPDSFLVVGGQHGGTLGRLIFEDFADLDLLCMYEGEKVLEQLCEILEGHGSVHDLKGVIYHDRKNGSFYENYEMPELVDLNAMPLPHYELYPNYYHFTPFVEESRGCPKNCKYCVNCSYQDRQYRYKSAEKFIRDLDHTISFFGTEPFYAVLSANFGVNPTNTSQLLEGMKGRNIYWATELCVENPWPRYIDKLGDAGLRLMGTGLESASAEILLRMNKTKNPSAYLDRASQLITKASELGLNPTFNIMCYIGETQHTIKETLKFLMNLEHCIHRVDAYSVFEFQGTEVARNFACYQKQYGCSRVMTDYTRKTHSYPLNISSEIDFSLSNYYCELIKYLFSDTRVRQLGDRSYDYKNLSFLAQ